MRWPFRNQVLVRMLFLVLFTIGAITLANIRSVIKTSQTVQLDQLDQLTELLQTSRFPLTDTVLQTMKSLSGADFVLLDSSGHVLGRTQGAPSVPDESQDLKSHPQSLNGREIESDGQQYYHAVVKTLGVNGPQSSDAIHIFVQRRSNLSIWWTSSQAPMLIALIVLPLACLISFALAGHVTRPLAALREQVHEIAGGALEPKSRSLRNDEIGDLSRSIDEMAVKLWDHENQMRQNERLRTLVQFGHGVAHHLRNSATGCQLAIELLGGQNEGIANSENYQVAIRQLGLMNNYIKKFLLLSKTPIESRQQPVSPLDLNDVLKHVVFLLKPSAEHLNVELRVDAPSDVAAARLTEEDAEQLMMNLIGNAITAASEMSASTQSQAVVEVKLVASDGRVSFSVVDNGVGPPEEIAESLFEPFVSGFKDGTGLGLSLVKKVAERAQGDISWSRGQGKTKFVFQCGTPGLPAPQGSEETSCTEF